MGNSMDCTARPADLQTRSGSPWKLIGLTGIMEVSCANGNGAPYANSPWPADTAAQRTQSLERRRIFSYSEEIITKTGNRSAHSGFNTLPGELC